MPHVNERRDEDRVPEREPRGPGAGTGTSDREVREPGRPEQTQSAILEPQPPPLEDVTDPLEDDPAH